MRRPKAASPKKNPARVPLSAPVDLIGTERTIQVDHWRAPSCTNFRVPARTKHAKLGPSVGGDPASKLASTIKGMVPSIRCKACIESPPPNSNACIAAEIDRLADGGGCGGGGRRELPESRMRARCNARHAEAYISRRCPAASNGR